MLCISRREKALAKGGSVKAIEAGEMQDPEVCSEMSPMKPHHQSLAPALVLAGIVPNAFKPVTAALPCSRRNTALCASSVPQLCSTGSGGCALPDCNCPAPSRLWQPIRRLKKQTPSDSRSLSAACRHFNRNQQIPTTSRYHTSAYTLVFEMQQF